MQSRENSITKEHIFALINRISCHLSKYLNDNTYHVMKKSKVDKLKQNSQVHINGYQATFHLHVKNTYIVVANNGNRNNVLTAKRLSNIIKLKSDLEQILLSSNIWGELPGTMLEKIRDLLDNAKIRNTGFSSFHKKNHVTYDENRLLRFNFVSSWKNKTWAQSRAMQALEASLKELDRFEKAYQCDNKSEFRRRM